MIFFHQELKMGSGKVRAQSWKQRVHGVKGGGSTTKLYYYSPFSKTVIVRLYSPVTHNLI